MKRHCVYVNVGLNKKVSYKQNNEFDILYCSVMKEQYQKCNYLSGGNTFT